MIQKSANLGSMYMNNLLLSKYANISIDTLNNLIPWEREVLLELYAQHVKDQQAAREKAQANRR